MMCLWKKGGGETASVKFELMLVFLKVCHVRLVRLAPQRVQCTHCV